MSKQHDFQLDQTLPDDHKLLVQFRRFDEAVVSDYELFISNSEYDDTFESFRKFAVGKSKRYNLFLRKWIRSERGNRILLRYDQLTSDPYRSVLKVLRLYDAEHYEPCIKPAIERVSHISFANSKALVHPKPGVVNRRNFREFRHYHAGLFARLHEMANSHESVDTGGIS